MSRISEIMEEFDEFDEGDVKVEEEEVRVIIVDEVKDDSEHICNLFATVCNPFKSLNPLSDGIQIKAVLMGGH